MGQESCELFYLLFYLLIRRFMEGFQRLQQFSKLSLESKQEVISEGSPTPELKGLIQTTGRTSRCFQTEWYRRLCGCQATDRLLFSPGDDVWASSGYRDLKDLQRSLSKHVQSQISLKTFGTSGIDLALEERNTDFIYKLGRGRNWFKVLL